MAPTPAQTDDLGELLRLIRRDEFTRDLKPVIAKKSNSYLRQTHAQSQLASRIRLENQDANETDFAWDRWYVFPRQSYEFVPGESCRIQTGWTILSYPYEKFSLELCLSECAVRRGMALCNPSLDGLYGLEGCADITPVVLNTNIREMIRVDPTDEYFVLRLVPKCYFYVDMNGNFSEIDKMLHFRKPEPLELRRPLLKQFSVDSLDDSKEENEFKS